MGTLLDEIISEAYGEEGAFPLSGGRPVWASPNESEMFYEVKVTGGEFGKALSSPWLRMPEQVGKLLKLSKTFVKMASKLDDLYVHILDPKNQERALQSVFSENGVVTKGPFIRRRVIGVQKSFTGNSWFAPYSFASPGYYDAINIETIDSANTGKWIEIMAHETAHAFRFANGQLFRPKVTCPQSKKVTADVILSSINDEILARKIEAQVLKEIQAVPDGKAVAKYQPTTGSTDQKVVERDFLAAEWEGTYLEHFVLDTLLSVAVVCEKLDENAVKAKNLNVDRIPLGKRKLDDYLINQNFFDPDSGKLSSFVTQYARLRFIRRVIDARWKQFKQQKNASKEKTLQEHCRAFFQGVINYTPLNP